MADFNHRPSFRQRVAAGERLIGTIITLSDPALTEVMSQAGFDWLWFDGEHTTLDAEAIQSLMRAAGVCHPFVRVPAVDEIWVKKLLDAGAEGIVFPLVNTREQAERAVALTKYPPLGERSIGFARAQAYGVTFDSYLGNANYWVCTTLQIEHIMAVENIDAILAVPGIDALVVGPYDLSSSMGLPGKLDAPEVQSAIDRVVLACCRAQKTLGIFAPNVDRALLALERGYDFVVVGIDVMLLTALASEMISRLKPGPLSP
jgi:2-keto-3-deoxy-L-rhamnonate aldolase RhmA